MRLDIERYLEKFWSKHKFRTIIGGLGFLLLGVALLVSLILASSQPSQVEILSSEEKDNGEVVIDVAGAVERPGIYQIERGARINDALIAAGGLSASADRNWLAKNLNLAAKIKDGTKIYIPFSGDNQANFVSVQGGAMAGETSGESKININTGAVSELEKLPGIGPALAQRIIDYRTRNGSYSNIEDLLDVSGIGEKLFAQIKDRVTLW